MLEAINLTVLRGGNTLFRELSFRVERGATLLIRGPNGSGKTTLLRVLCGLTRPEHGEVRWDGESAVDTLPARLAYAGHQPGLKQDLTVRQNLAFYRRLLPGGRQPSELIEGLGLQRCADLEFRHLSAGQKRRTGLARVVMSEATVWLLDEPFTNLDVEGHRLVEDHIATHLSNGGLAVIAAHEDVLFERAQMTTLILGAG